MFSFISKVVRPVQTINSVIYRRKIAARQKWLNSLDLSTRNIMPLVDKIESYGGLEVACECDYNTPQFKAYDHLVQCIDNLAGTGSYEYYYSKVKSVLPEFTY